MCISRSGFAKRAVRVAAWADAGERALRFAGRRERRSKEVGIDSGIGSDMFGSYPWKVICLVVERIRYWGGGGYYSSGSSCSSSV